MMAVYCTEREEYVPYLTCMDCCGCRGGRRTKREEMLDLLKDLVGKLSLSEKNHTKEELKSPKYVKAYNGLREKIKEVASDVIEETVSQVNYEIGEMSEDEISSVQQIFDGIIRYTSIILYKHKDVELFELVLDHSSQLVQSMLGDIWVSRQHKKEKE